MAKAATKKPATRKAQAKKANAPMKNAPKEKSPRTIAKADAKKAARTMAKTVKPGIKKSAAKRVGKVESKPSLPARTKATPEEMADTLIAIIRKDLSDVTKHGASELKFRKMLKAMFTAALEAKGIK